MLGTASGTWYFLINILFLWQSLLLTVNHETGKHLSTILYKTFYHHLVSITLDTILHNILNERFSYSEFIPLTQDISQQHKHLAGKHKFWVQSQVPKIKATTKSTKKPNRYYSSKDQGKENTVFIECSQYSWWKTSERLEIFS